MGASARHHDDWTDASWCAVVGGAGFVLLCSGCVQLSQVTGELCISWPLVLCFGCVVGAAVCLSHMVDVADVCELGEIWQMGVTLMLLSCWCMHACCWPFRSAVPRSAEPR